MARPTRVARLVGLLVAALLAADCRDSISPERPLLGGGIPSLDVVGGPGGGSLHESGTGLVAKFGPNAHHGDASISTFFWLGSSYIFGSCCACAHGPHDR